MEKVYIVSRCIKENNHHHYLFNFKGFYRGNKIKEIITSGSSFVINEDYLVLLTEIRVRDKVLYGKVIKSKKLFT